MKAWPADNVERRPIDELVPAAHNARTHSEDQISKIAASMREWGWTNPVLVDEAGVIIAGHGRVLAAQTLGWTEAPIMVAKEWTEAQKRAYLIADNKLPELAGWDDGMLSIELAALSAADFDLGLTGFAQDELSDLIQPLDAAPQLTDGFKFSVIVEAKDEADQARLLEQFEADGLICRLLITQ